METQIAATPTLKTKDGREFAFIGEEPYRRKDGTDTTLMVWGTPCVKCGEVFTVRTPNNTSRVEHSSAFGAKHCQKHKLTPREVRALGLAAMSNSERGQA